MKESQWNLRHEDLQLYSKEIPEQVLSSEFCEIFKKNYFAEHLRTAVSGKGKNCFPVLCENSVNGHKEEDVNGDSVRKSDGRLRFY